mmetsp:Transcript_46724/g.102028  ORF Transcript_46724/g.102028 Transcript_46724/m.102028 type:complete len:241 (+) Transcript_46724:973-1695(+)
MSANSCAWWHSGTPCAQTAATAAATAASPLPSVRSRGASSRRKARRSKVGAAWASASTGNSGSSATGAAGTSLAGEPGGDAAGDVASDAEGVVERSQDEAASASLSLAAALSLSARAALPLRGGDQGASFAPRAGLACARVVMISLRQMASLTSPSAPHFAFGLPTPRFVGVGCCSCSAICLTSSIFMGLACLAWIGPWLGQPLFLMSRTSRRRKRRRAGTALSAVSSCICAKIPSRRWK